MQLKKRSFLYRFNAWWDFSHWCDLQLRYPVSRTNICKLFWLTVFSLFVGWPIIFVAQVAMWTFACATLAIAIGILAPMGFLFAQKINLDEVDEVFAPIEKWPKLLGRRIYPIYPLLLAGAIFLANAYRNEAVLPARWIGTGGLVIFCIVAIILVVSMIVSIIGRTDTWRTIGAYIAAKKEKYCVPVEFVD